MDIEQIQKQLQSITPKRYTEKTLKRNIRKIHRSISCYFESQDLNKFGHPCLINSLLETSLCFPKLKQIDDISFVLKLSRRGRDRIAFMPFKENGETVLDEELISVLQYLKERNETKEMGGESRIDNAQEKLVRNIECSEIKKTKYDIECIFDINKTNKLEGSEYKELRYYVNRFKRENEGFEVEDLKTKDMNEILEMGNYMVEKHGNRKPTISLFQYLSNYRMVKRYDKSLVGFVVKLNDSIVGVHAFSIIRNMGIVPVSRSKQSVYGCSEFMFHLDCSKIIENTNDVNFINIGGFYGNRTVAEDYKLQHFKLKFNPIKEVGKTFALHYIGN